MDDVIIVGNTSLSTTTSISTSTTTTSTTTIATTPSSSTTTITARGLPGNATAVCWKFFNLKPGNECLATCILCKEDISRGKPGEFGTSSMARHLKRKHQGQWDDAG